MQIIRSAQLGAMLDACLPAIGRSLLPYMRAHHEAATAALDDDVLLRHIACGLRRARRWGCDSPFGLTLFVALMLEIAPDFDTHPTIRALLSDPARQLDARLADMASVLDEDGWAQLALSADPQAWND